MSTLLGLILLWPFAVLATWQAVETWHHGSIFDEWRAYFEARSSFLSSLLLCPFCLSHWVAAQITIAVFAAFNGFQPSLYLLFLLPVYWLSVTRGSNLCNDACHSFCRTPTQDKADAIAQRILEGIANGDQSVYPIPADTIDYKLEPQPFPPEAFRPGSNRPGGSPGSGPDKVSP